VVEEGVSVGEHMTAPFGRGAGHNMTAAKVVKPCRLYVTLPDPAP